MADTIHQRMASVMKAVHGVKKNDFNPQGKYKYAGHEAVTAALRDEYVRTGIIRSASVKSHTRGNDGCLSVLVAVRWTNADNPADFWEVDSLGEAPSPTKAREPTGQQAGVAVSYAVKIAELKQFSLTGDDTTDNEANDHPGDALVAEFVDGFAKCSTMLEIEELNARVRENWRAVQGEQAALFAARGEAMKRIAK